MGGAGSDIGTGKTTGAGGSDEASPWFETRVGGFEVPTVFAVPKEC